MKTYEKKMLDLFKVEELEERYEMKGWIRIEYGSCGCDDAPGVDV